MDICHLKKAVLKQRYQNYKGQVVLRSDTVKDDSGSYDVFTEQGSSASQMTAAIVMDIIARLPECAGQAADAVSAFSQVQMEDAPKLLQIPKSVLIMVTLVVSFMSMWCPHHFVTRHIQLILFG